MYNIHVIVLIAFINAFIYIYTHVRNVCICSCLMACPDVPKDRRKPSTIKARVGVLKAKGGQPTMHQLTLPRKDVHVGLHMAGVRCSLRLYQKAV